MITPKILSLPPLLLLLFTNLSFAEEQKPAPDPNRVASIFISQSFLNSQIKLHNKSEIIKDVRLVLDPDGAQIFLRGLLQVPTEELRAVNLDPQMGAFRFQVTLKPEVSRRGHLILEFPLNETFFYPADSDNPKRDRVVIPVQMLSLALASARGYLSALSGDFSSFDRRTTKLTSLIKDLDKIIAKEKNPDALDDLKNQREGLRIQLSAVPVERRQLQALAKELVNLLGFTGEKELNLNQELGARKNALILKIKVSQLVPYLKYVEIGGIRIRHDKLDGNGENFIAIDVDAALEAAQPPTNVSRNPRKGMAQAPVLIIRLNQALLESKTVVESEKSSLGSKLTDFKTDLKEDGLHVSGRYHKFFFSVPFDVTVDFASTATDVFEVRVRRLDVAGMNLEFMTGFVLESVKAKLDNVLKGRCTFDYIGEESDHSRALRVTVNSKSLVPAFPNLHLVAVDVREREFLLKIGADD